MYRVTMLYPQTEDSHFDMEHFTGTHIPRIREIFGDLGLRDIEVERGIAGAMPGQGAPFMCISSFVFETLEGFQQGMAAQGAWIVADVPNYTNSQPVIQIGAVIVSEQA